MDKLLPCPFCGGEATLKTTRKSDGQISYDSSYVLCLDCRSTGLSFTKYYDVSQHPEQEAIAAWNRRAQPANEPLTLDELRELDGEPVYIVTLENQLENPPYWAIVGISKNDSRYQGGVTLYNKIQGDWGSIGLYGKTWLAYRHKPKEEHHEAN